MRRMITRRMFLGTLGAWGLATAGGIGRGTAAGPMLTRVIPASAEPLPVIGMGSWITFDVGGDAARRAARADVLRAFFEAGGTVIDSSLMYGSSEEVIGWCLHRIDDGRAPFAATKVWTRGRWAGRDQMRDSAELWGVPRFDLMQVHNLVDWQTHLKTLTAMKEGGELRYIGVTTSHGRRHGALAHVMARESIDFVQFTYNILDRAAESRLLPLAAERGLAVIVNRPFRRGALFDLFERHPLPDWAREFDATNWAQFFLKFIVSHPAVTCAIPATSRVDHMQENMGALYGRLPDAEMRARMARYVEGL
jgi:diketogulonate reductase-like aldo/keto reductase